MMLSLAYMRDSPPIERLVKLRTADGDRTNALSRRWPYFCLLA